MTADSAEPERKIDAHDLDIYLRLFIDRNKDSRDVTHRWLASYAADLKAQAYNVKACNRDTIKAAVDAFRLAEIRQARSELAKQDSVLASEAAALEDAGKG